MPFLYSGVPLYVFHIFCICLFHCPPCPFFLFHTALAELQQAGLLTSDECKGNFIHAVSGKSPAVVSQACEILTRHGFETESKFIAGKQIFCKLSVFGCTYNGAKLSRPF